MGQTSKINVLRLGFVHYQHPDLASIGRFLEDFGLIKVSQQGSRAYYRGYGVDPYIYVAEQSPSGTREFMGAAWVVESAQDLELAATQANASPIQTNDGPGGGQIVSIKDPNNFVVSFIYSQELREREPQASVARHTTENASNEALTKQRHGDFRRFNRGPSLVHKLGHYGFIVPKSKYRDTFDFYLSLIKLKPSDAVYDPVTGDDKTCFIHIDHGNAHTDHHSFFIGWQAEEGKAAFVHHSSFEVNDFDTQSLGHDWLQSRGWTNCWGIGRHVLGSQIFDYWFDASGNIIEHYSDGDLVNQNNPFTREAEAEDTLYVWGPNVPLAYITGKLEDALSNPESQKKLPVTMPDPVAAVEAQFA
ncbi:hypothetical protein ACEPPN_017683 [Leptodophora sp. 'Broadleaf-Isolate-01']